MVQSSRNSLDTTITFSEKRGMETLSGYHCKDSRLIATVNCVISTTRTKKLQVDKLKEQKEENVAVPKCRWKNPTPRCYKMRRLTTKIKLLAEKAIVRILKEMSLFEETRFLKRVCVLPLCKTANLRFLGWTFLENVINPVQITSLYFSFEWKSSISTQLDLTFLTHAWAPWHWYHMAPVHTISLAGSLRTAEIHPVTLGGRQ